MQREIAAELKIPRFGSRNHRERMVQRIPALIDMEKAVKVRLEQKYVFGCLFLILPLKFGQATTALRGAGWKMPGHRISTLLNEIKVRVSCSSHQFYPVPHPDPTLLYPIESLAEPCSCRGESV